MTAIKHTYSIVLALTATLALAGCAGDGGGLSTASLLTPDPEPAKVERVSQPRVDPACVTLTSQIDALRREGIADKVEKAAQKKHKLSPAEITKADQLNKVNADFQMKCSTITPRSTQTASVAPVTPTPPVNPASVTPKPMVDAAKATTTAAAMPKP